MFNQISSTYDLLNRILSLGIDRQWRKKAVSYLPPFKKITLLDMATGTGDFLISFAKDPRVVSLVGADLSEKMLAKCDQKIKKVLFHKKKKVKLQIEDLEKLSFSAHSFEAVTIAFGIRNVDNPLKALKETYRVLKKKGRLIILELSIPKNFILKFLYLIYFRNIVPFIGGLVSGNFKAYRYLNQTTEEFPQRETFCLLLEKAGFSKSYYKSMTLGIVCLYIGEK